MFPEPVTRRVLAFARLVDAAGWEAACDLAAEPWEGWEADVLAEGLPMVLGAWEAQERSADRRWWARLLGGR